ncbi:MAG: hypothetical protein Q9202_001670 [Teloschistes flavicans]
MVSHCNAGHFESWYPPSKHVILQTPLTQPGGVMSGASPAYNTDEMTYALKTANAKYLMAIPSSMDVAVAAARNVGIPKERIILLDGHLNGYTTVKQVIERGRSLGQQAQVPSFKIPKGKRNKDICALLSFSSGTTGLPKAVMIAHSNILAQCMQVQPITASDHDKVLGLLPFYHITALSHGLHLPVLLNAELYVLPAFSMKAMLETAAKYKIKELLIVPPILIRFVRDPIVDQYDLSHLRRFSTGAAPISEEIIQLLQTKFPQTSFKQGYGMTESTACITSHPAGLYDYKYAHFVGQLIPGTEAKIVDLDGKELGVNERGEVLARGPQVVMGYLNNAKATAETFDQDGWLHTGDEGFFNEEGWLTITDRIKEMIKVKGIGVAPAELEDLLLGHPKVEDAAVLGIPDDYAGERPKAFVVPKKGDAVGDEALAEELLQYAKARKVRHKWIAEIEFADEIPKSASGKILRRVLRERSKGKGVRNTGKEKAKL